MKITLISLFCALIFSVCITEPFFSRAAEAPDAVLDTAGKQLRAGAEYFILPALPHHGGGLSLESTGNKNCPLDVVQEQYGTPGIPLAFTPVNSKKGVIRVSTDLNIIFPNTYTKCPQSNVWMLDHYDPSTRNYFVTTGGVEGNPGPGTIKNWFKIEKFGNGYKLMYCPTVCNYCRAMCRGIGIVVENGKRRLALSDSPMNVKFQKV